MSRIGKKEITIPQDTYASIEKDNVIVKGKYGTLNQPILNGIKVVVCDKKIIIKRENDFEKSYAFHGLMRTMINNMILGVNEKFTRTLLVEGVGYKFQMANNLLYLNMGLSHIVKYAIPETLSVILESPTKIAICGINKQEVGLFASKIREIRPPEPYKGKGIRFEGENIRRKPGKARK